MFAQKRIKQKLRLDFPELMIQIQVWIFNHDETAINNNQRFEIKDVKKLLSNSIQYNEQNPISMNY